jgi:hypothetical protein
MCCAQRAELPNRVVQRGGVEQDLDIFPGIGAVLLQDILFALLYSSSALFFTKGHNIRKHA